MKKKIIALDWGSAWIGVASCDVDILIPTPYTTWKFKNHIEKLKQYANLYIIDKIIVGIPITFNNSHSEQTKKIIAEAEQLKKYFPDIELIFINERLSSKHAHNMICFHNNPLIKKKVAEDFISEHSLAALFLLEDYIKQIKTIK